MKPAEPCTPFVMQPLDTLASPVTLDSVLKTPAEGSQKSLFSVAWPLISTLARGVTLAATVEEEQ